MKGHNGFLCSTFRYITCQVHSGKLEKWKSTSLTSVIFISPFVGNKILIISIVSLISFDIRNDFFFQNLVTRTIIKYNQHKDRTLVSSLTLGSCLSVHVRMNMSSIEKDREVSIYSDILSISYIVSRLLPPRLFHSS